MNTDCNIELDYIDKKKLLYVHIDIFTSSSCRKRRWTSSDVCDMTPFLTPFFWSSTERVVGSYRKRRL